MTAQGTASSGQPTTSFNITAALAGMEEESKVVSKGPRLVSRTYSRLILSRGSTTTLNCTVEQAGDVAVSAVGTVVLYLCFRPIFLNTSLLDFLYFKRLYLN